MNKPLKLLIYYGWLNSFNSSENGWDNDLVAMDLAKYNILVFGSGLADPDHGDYANTVSIIQKIRTINPSAKIFGYVDAELNHLYAEYSTSSETSDTQESESSSSETSESSSPTVDEMSSASSQSQQSESSNTEDSLSSSSSVVAAVDATPWATQVRQWNELEVDGIFFDQAGYDFGTVETNSRQAMNEKVRYVHSQLYANLCFLNAWNIDHVLTLENDASYPNSVWNPDLLSTELREDDWFLFESFAYDINHNSGGAEDEHYENRSDWYARASKVKTHAGADGVNVAAVSRIDPSSTGKQDYLDFAYRAAAMWNFEAFGSADPNYGASSAKTSYYTRPELPDDVYNRNPVATHPNDADAYVKFYEHAMMILDFSDGAEGTTLTSF